MLERRHIFLQKVEGIQIDCRSQSDEDAIHVINFCSARLLMKKNCVIILGNTYDNRLVLQGLKA